MVKGVRQSPSGVGKVGEKEQFPTVTQLRTMENLIQRIRSALYAGLSGTEIAKHFANESTPEEVWLAYKAAQILNSHEAQE